MNIQRSFQLHNWPNNCHGILSVDTPYDIHYKSLGKRIYCSCLSTKLNISLLFHWPHILSCILYILQNNLCTIDSFQCHIFGTIERDYPKLCYFEGIFLFRICNKNPIRQMFDNLKQSMGLKMTLFL